MLFILYLCIYNSRPTIENKLIKTPFIEAPVGRCGFDWGILF